jgi:hypothetical protein
MRYIILIASFLSLSSILSAQCDSTKWASEGTYVLIKTNANSEANSITRTPLTSDQLCLIESSRNDFYFAFITLDANTRVKIYPRYSNNNNIER